MFYKKLKYGIIKREIAQGFPSGLVITLQQIILERKAPLHLRPVIVSPGTNGRRNLEIYDKLKLKVPAGADILKLNRDNKELTIKLSEYNDRLPKISECRIINPFNKLPNKLFYIELPEMGCFNPKNQIGKVQIICRINGGKLPAYLPIKAKLCGIHAYFRSDKIITIGVKIAKNGEGSPEKIEAEIFKYVITDDDTNNYFYVTAERLYPRNKDLYSFGFSEPPPGLPEGLPENLRHLIPALTAAIKKAHCSLCPSGHKYPYIPHYYSDILWSD